jgi:DNA-binding beta-propeller fold protein YncE
MSTKRSIGLRFVSARFGKSALLFCAVLCFSCAARAQIIFTGAQFTVPATGLSGPSGAAVDTAGDVYIADTGNNRILKIDPKGNQTVVTVGAALLGPHAVAVDLLGNLYISDSGHNRIIKVPAGGGSPASLGTGLSNPAGIAVDAPPSGPADLFIADNGLGRVVKISGAGAQSVLLDSLGNVRDVAVDRAGNIYVADADASSITEIPTIGPPITVGGASPIPKGWRRMGPETSTSRRAAAPSRRCPSPAPNSISASPG